MTRREWLTAVTAAGAASSIGRAAENAPAAPVSIAKVPSYDGDLAASLNTMFDQIGGLSGLVKNKTVTIKVNMTGPASMRFHGLPLASTHYTHPKLMAAAAHLMDRAGARRIRFVEGSSALGTLEESMAASGWDVAALRSAAKTVEFENTNNLGTGKRYARLMVPSDPHIYPGFDFNRAYEETDVYVSMAKLKNHAICGVTLSMKNTFGAIPVSIYGGDAGMDEPNERARSNRAAVGHNGRRQPSKSAPQELNFGANHDPGYRMPRVVADLAAARPIHLAIIDGIETTAGGEGPWIQSVRAIKPGVLIAGVNPVCTDTVATAVMGYDPRAARGKAPFPECDNTLMLAEGHGIGTTDLRRIEVRGVPIDRAMFRFQA